IYNGYRLGLFYKISDIFNDTDFPLLSDNNDININLCPSSSNHNDYDTISLNSASTLCELEEAIDKKYKEKNRYYKLTDLKSQHTTIGLPYILFQFFPAIDNKKHLIPEDLYADTIDSNFIEDITDELQATLKAILSNTDISNIIEM
ncbi:4980_t:CDS:2, partial [Gigaspora margarita]